MDNSYISIKDSFGDVSEESYTINNDSLVINAGIDSVNVNINHPNKSEFFIRVNDESTVSVVDTCRIFAGSNSIINGNNNLVISAGDNSIIDIACGSKIFVGNYSAIQSLYNNHIVTGDFSKVVTRDYSQVKSGQHSSIICCDNSVIEVGNFSSVECYGDSTIKVSYKTTLYLRKKFKVESLIPCGLIKIERDRLYLDGSIIHFMEGEKISIKEDHIILSGMELSFDDYNSLALMKKL